MGAGRTEPQKRLSERIEEAGIFISMEEVEIKP